ncbi:MAG TPA: ATPase, T2SS/T4P/T4SS family, partial [bacterium]|nr:ATPase, T2SS/T4P/T4SS family [bacterium]
LGRLRESSWGATLRIVAMSALATPEDAALWLRAGCVGAIEKPIDVTTFAQEISRWVSGAAPEAQPSVGAPERKGEKFWEILVANGLITPEQLTRAMTAQAATGKRIGHILVEQEHVSEDDVAWAFGHQLGYPYIYPTLDIIDQEVARLLPEAFLRERHVLPILKFGREMTLAMADPTDQRTVDEVVRRTGVQVNRALTLGSHIQQLLDALFAREAAARSRGVAPEAQYLQFHLVQALRQGASEIHLDPAVDAQARVRYRLHGVPVDRTGHPSELHLAILQYLRHLTGLEEAPFGTAAATVQAGGTELQMVVTFLPTVAGPAASLRLYPRRADVPDFAPLGLSTETIRPLSEALQGARGIVLVGCGDPVLRSTLLHGLIPSSYRGKVWTLETVPSYRRATLNQTVLGSPSEAPGHLRAAASAGSDLIMVDDISAGCAAVLAAHEVARTRMVLAGHPEDDVVALSSEILECVGPARVASTLRGVLVARGIRLRCPACKLPSTGGPGSLQGKQTFIAQGCGACHMTGFGGQRVLAQVWCMNQEVRRLLHSGRIRAAVERITQETAAGLRDQGLALVEDGLTPPDELAGIVDQV